MQNGEDVPAATETTKKPVPEEVTKQSFRQKVWRHLETNGLAMFPRPVYNRIPNFKGALEAAAKLAELEVFKNANTVKVNPDKPQEPVRVICLEQQKTLYVPVPRLQTGFLNRLELPEGETGPAAIRKAVSRNGMETYGKPIGIEETVSLDLVVMGSVAVSKEGYRIGKGRGYGDLEFGLMMHMKAMKPTTLVATTVHDCQVFDTLPAELFGPHDVPIDIIVTPTQVIETQRMSQRPPGILWHLLSNRRIQLMPVLGQLREVEMLAGRACTLKEVDTDVEERAAQRPRRTRRRTRSHKSHSEGEGNTTEGEEGKTAGKPRRTTRRRNSNKSASKEGDAKPRRTKRPRPVIDFSVKISNIGPNTRVRDLKQALSERGVKPQIMVWKGFRGFCYLHFFKPGPQKGEGDSTATVNMESVLSALQAMSLGGSGGAAEGEEPRDDKPRLLTVEPAPPRNPPPAPTPQEVGHQYPQEVGHEGEEPRDDKPRLLTVEPAPPRNPPPAPTPQEVGHQYPQEVGHEGEEPRDDKPRLLTVEPAPPRNPPPAPTPQEVGHQYPQEVGHEGEEPRDDKPRLLTVEPAPPRNPPPAPTPQEVGHQYPQEVGHEGEEPRDDKPRLLTVEPAPPRNPPPAPTPQEVGHQYPQEVGHEGEEPRDDKPRLLTVEPAPPRNPPPAPTPQEVGHQYPQEVGHEGEEPRDDKPRLLTVEPAPPRNPPPAPTPQEVGHQYPQEVGHEGEEPRDDKPRLLTVEPAPPRNPPPAPTPQEVGHQYPQEVGHEGEEPRDDKPRLLTVEPAPPRNPPPAPTPQEVH